MESSKITKRENSREKIMKNKAATQEDMIDKENTEGNLLEEKKEYNELKNKKFASRLKQLRTERGISQTVFAQELGVFTGRKKAVSISSVSSWELGMKVPDYKRLAGIASYFGVSIEYLVGTSDRRDFDENVKPLLFLEDYTCEISIEELSHYDGKPVYLVFRNKKIKPTWGIYNKDKECFNCRDSIYRNSPGLRYFVTLEGAIKKRNNDLHPLSLEEIIKKKCFWVEYVASTTEINYHLSGWYINAQGNVGIMNKDGLVLPYSGLNVHYHCYKDVP